MYEDIKSSFRRSIKKSRTSGGIFDIAGKKERIAEIETMSAAPNFWNDNEKAQTVLKEMNQLQGLGSVLGQARIPETGHRPPAPDGGRREGRRAPLRMSPRP